MNNEYFMKVALKEAKIAYSEGEVPVGCVIAKGTELISRAHNKIEKHNDGTYHAEMIAIREASKKLGRRLTDCSIFVTIEPCPMCMGAIIQSRISNLIFGAYDEKFGACGSVINITEAKFNHNVNINSGLLEEGCRDLMQEFFKELRRSK